MSNDLLGLWWTPDSNEKWSGAISISDEEVSNFRLMHDINTTEGMKQLKTAFDPDFSVGIPLVHGKTEDGNCWSFFNLRFRNLNISETILNAHYLAGMVMKGEHISNIDEKFSKFRAKYSGLDAWIAKTERRPDELKTDLKLVCSADLPELNAKINFYREVFLNYDDTVVSAQQFSFVELIPSEPSTIKWADIIFTDLANLLAVCLSATCRVTQFKAWHNENWIDISFPSRMLPSSSETITTSACIPFGRFQSGLPELLNRWFSRSGTARRASLLYARYFLDTKTPQDSKFLFLVLAIELYHRGKFGTTKPLSKRLKHIFREYLANSCIESITTDDIKFASLAAHTRNYLSHFNVKENEQVLDGIDVVDANKILHVLFRIVFYKDFLCMHDDEIRLFLNKIWRDKYNVERFRPINPYFEGGFTSPGLFPN